MLAVIQIERKKCQCGSAAQTAMVGVGVCVPGKVQTQGLASAPASPPDVKNVEHSMECYSRLPSEAKVSHDSKIINSVLPGTNNKQNNNKK